MSRRLAGYGVCIQDGRVLLAKTREGVWTLPGGQVELGEDPFDTVVREFAEETGCVAVVERLLGVDSRVIPAAEARQGIEHQNIGIFYAVRITAGEPAPHPEDDIVECAWTPIADVVTRRRSSLVDVGIALAHELPPTGHVPAVSVGGLIEH